MLFQEVVSSLKSLGLSVRCQLELGCVWGGGGRLQVALAICKGGGSPPR